MLAGRSQPSVAVQDLPGMALWLRHQADEEIVHANKFIDHVVDRGNHPSIGVVEAPAVPGVELVADGLADPRHLGRETSNKASTSARIRSVGDTRARTGVAPTSLTW